MEIVAYSDARPFQAGTRVVRTPPVYDENSGALDAERQKVSEVKPARPPRGRLNRKNWQIDCKNSAEVPKAPEREGLCGRNFQRQTNVSSDSVSATATSISAPQPSNLTPRRNFAPHHAADFLPSDGPA